MEKNKIGAFGSRMDSLDSRLTLAILSQNNRNIGLFEHVRIDDEESIHSISYFKPHNGPLAQFVRPRAELSYDGEYNSVMSTEHLDVVLQYNIPTGFHEPIPLQIQSVILYRLPFQVKFWEGNTDYPVYMMNPDYILPWDRTVSTIVHLPNMTTYEPRHYRLQMSPASSPQYSPQYSPKSPQRSGFPIKRTLSTSAVCPITLTALSMASVFWTPCGHAFSSAIEEALRRDPRCPMCRRRCRFNDCTLPA